MTRTAPAQVQVFPFTYALDDMKTTREFASVEAARKYLDRMGRMDARQSRGAKVTVRTAKAHGAQHVVAFPRLDGRFRAL